MPPWLVDRMLRNVLIDVTGNTHRSEFCIDKLYSPDSSTGRLGLLELRAFEMPPHARMSIVQQLLLRALVARFWESPYRAPLVRWGTALHDRFMLRASCAWTSTTCSTNWARRDSPSPTTGSHRTSSSASQDRRARARGVNLVLRQALEPWHVMGEEGAAGGTVRYVDSSLERIEILAAGLTDPRHASPSTAWRCRCSPPDAPASTYAAFAIAPGSRPPRCIRRSACTRRSPWTWWTGGWSDRWPAASTTWRTRRTQLRELPGQCLRSESRRLARFFTIGHTPGRVRAGVPVHSREFPFTLDLRTART